LHSLLLHQQRPGAGNALKTHRAGRTTYSQCLCGSVGREISTCAVAHGVAYGFGNPQKCTQHPGVGLKCMGRYRVSTWFSKVDRWGCTSIPSRLALHPTQGQPPSLWHSNRCHHDQAW
jgi:hypothetical protein